MEELKKEWEREFEKKFVLIPPPESHPSGRILLKPYEIKGSVYDIKSFISSLLAKQQEMTNSEWVALGKKLGYHDYWKDMTRIALQEEFVKSLPNPKIHSLPDGVNSPHETEHDRGWNDCIADIKSKLNI